MTNTYEQRIKKILAERVETKKKLEEILARLSKPGFNLEQLREEKNAIEQELREISLALTFQQALLNHTEVQMNLKSKSIITPVKISCNDYETLEF